MLLSGTILVLDLYLFLSYYIKRLTKNMSKPKGMSQQEFEKLLDVLPTLDND